MTSYGSVPTNEDSTVSNAEQHDVSNEGSHTKYWRTRLGEKLENEKFHWLVLILVLIDATCVIIQIIYTFFHECQVPSDYNSTLLQSHDGHWLLVAFEMAEVVSMVICMVFVLECVLSFVAFGHQYYSPGWPHWKLHVFDFIVVFTTFVLEVGLRGKEREIAGLLIIFRLWRVVKVVEAVIVSVSFTQQEELERVKAQYKELESKYTSLLLAQQE